VRSECAGHPACADTEIVASELAANAIAHTKSGGGLFMVHVAPVNARCLALVVTDQGAPTPPRARDAGMDAESGRGLDLVAALASVVVVAGDQDARSMAVVVPASSGTYAPAGELLACAARSLAHLAALIAADSAADVA
jgi:anti-sigma regulatory factor (Ser/Thr protein kinase)